MRLTQRGGTFYRIVNPNWADPLDTSHAKAVGGRWNPADAFGALYLNATIDVAAANARWKHRDRAIKLFDLNPEARPTLITLAVATIDALDIVSAIGVVDNGFSTDYPIGSTHAQCQAVAKRAYDANIRGVACRSAAEAVAGSWVGEELALFDTAPPPRESAPRRGFSDWYPDSIP